MQPTIVAYVAARFGRREVRVVAIEPLMHVVEINLFAPKHARKSLALHAPLVFSRLRRMNRLVEFIRFLSALLEDFFNVLERIGQLLIGQAQLQDDRAACGHVQFVMKARLRTDLCGINALRARADAWLRLSICPPSIGPPSPSVAKPEVRQDVERRGFGAAIEGFDAYADVFRPGFGILDKYVEVAILVEHARV